MNAEPSGAGESGSMVWIGSHVPSVTSPTNRRTFGATERNAASTRGQVVGAVGSFTIGRSNRPPISPRLSTERSTRSWVWPPMVTIAASALGSFTLTDTNCASAADWSA